MPQGTDPERREPAKPRIWPKAAAADAAATGRPTRSEAETAAASELSATRRKAEAADALSGSGRSDATRARGATRGQRERRRAKHRPTAAAGRAGTKTKAEAARHSRRHKKKSNLPKSAGANRNERRRARPEAERARGGRRSGRRTEERPLRSREAAEPVLPAGRPTRAGLGDASGGRIAFFAMRMTRARVRGRCGRRLPDQACGDYRASRAYSRLDIQAARRRASASASALLGGSMHSSRASGHFLRS